MSTEDENTTTLDFGAGNTVVLPSRCLRVAKDPTDCDICADACPASAIVGKDLQQETEEDEPKPSPTELRERKLGVTVSEDCIHCGVCLTACPLEALSATKHHPKGVEKQLKEKADKLEGVSVGCARALYGVPQRLASKAVVLPCLAALSAEAWVLAATIARDALFDPSSLEENETGIAPLVSNLKVFLPSLICDDCPVNLCNDAEALYMDAIATAEAWGADNIELVSSVEELNFLHTGTLMNSLGDVAADGKRELVEQLAADLSRTWKNAGNDLSREKLKAEQLKKRRQKVRKTQQVDYSAPRPFGKKSVRRQMLRTAIEKVESLANEIELLCANTQAQLCIGCGACVDACSVNARRLISSNSVLYFGKLPEEERPQGTQAAVTDQLCCLGCSACVQKCPTGACTLTWLSGTDFYKLRQS